MIFFCDGKVGLLLKYWLEKILQRSLSSLLVCTFLITPWAFVKMLSQSIYRMDFLTNNIKKKFLKLSTTPKLESILKINKNKCTLANESVHIFVYTFTRRRHFEDHCRCVFLFQTWRVEWEADIRYRGWERDRCITCSKVTCVTVRSSTCIWQRVTAGSGRWLLNSTVLSILLNLIVSKYQYWVPFII